MLEMTECALLFRPAVFAPRQHGGKVDHQYDLHAIELAGELIAAAI
jgi:hypothetical protein